MVLFVMSLHTASSKMKSRLTSKPDLIVTVLILTHLANPSVLYGILPVFFIKNLSGPINHAIKIQIIYFVFVSDGLRQ